MTAKPKITLTTPCDNSGTSFLMPEISMKFQPDHPEQGAK